MIDIAQLGFRVESIEAELASRRLDKMSKSARRAETASERLAKSADKVGKSMQSMGRNMTLYVTTPILAMAAASVKAFADFDDAMISSMAIMGDLSDVMKKDMATAARKMGKTTVFSATQAAESYFFLASAGLDAAASIAALPRVAAFAQAGNFDMAKATDILTDAQSALGRVMKDPIENMKEMTALSDVLVKANTVANASVQQFGEALVNKAGAAMKSLNIDVEEGVAVLAAYADQGIKSAEAGEKFNIVTRDLQTAVRKNADEFERYGIKVFNSQGALNNLADIIGDLERALGPMSIKQQGATLALLGFQDRSVIAIRQLLGLSKSIRQYEADLRSAGGITDEVAAKQMESFSKQLGLMKDEIVDVSIELGASLAPAVIEIVGEIRDLAVGFKELSPETQKMIVKGALLAAALGPLLIVLGGIVRALPILIPLVIRFGAMIAAMPIAAAAIALAGLVKLFGDLYVAKLEAAIGVTGRFTTALAKLAEIEGLQTNLNTVNEQLDIFNDQLENQLSKFDAITAMLDDTEIISQPGQVDLLTAELGRLQAELEETNRFIEQTTQLRDSYIQRIEDATTATEAETEALQALSEATEPTALTFDTGAFADLLDIIDPATKALEAFTTARELLNKALKAGKAGGGIDLAEFQRLEKLLIQSTLHAEAFADAIANVEAQELFEGNASALQDEIDALNGGAEAWREYQKAMFQAQEVARLGPDATADQIESIKELAGELFEIQDALGGFSDAVITVGDKLIDAGNIAGGVFSAAIQTANQGSQEYMALAVAIEVANAAAAIGAILNQGQGDPYSAFVRMASMAAVVASLGFRIASIAGGGGSETQRSLREAQGTGTILGDAEAKSESILDAMEITADATSELVGINRGMLHALQSLTIGIENVVIQTTRGVGDIEHRPLPSEASFFDLIFGAGKFNLFGLNFIGEFLAKAFGGKVKLLDEGIEISGGRLNELINDVLVRAFQTISVKKHIFDDTDIKKKFADIDDSIADQFALVFTSMRDTVEQAAIAIGIPLDVIEDRLAAFEIATQTISFKDLTAEEQQEELLAVFSTIFDGLAMHVVPFIDEFQKIGEGLGETLVRVATSVQVVQEAVAALGFAADAVGTEAFAHMAVDLVELTGGVENFISQFSTFFDKFASDEQKLEFATNQLTRAFESVGLAIPNTSDGMIDLMMSLDATTEEGRRQIAMLLEIAGVAAEYYDLIDNAEKDRLKQARALADEMQRMADQIRAQRQTLAGFTGDTVHSGLLALRDDFLDAMDAADALGASQKEYVMIVTAFNNRLRRMAAELTLSVLSMSRQLFSQELDGIADDLTGGLQETREIANSVFDEWQRALEDIFDFTQSILLDENLTTLTPAEQFAEAQSQFDRLLSAAMGGDAEAAAALPEAAKALLEEARFMFASGQQFTDIFNAVLAALAGVDMPGGISPTIVEPIETPGLSDEKQTEGDALIEELERFLLALDLAGTLRNLSQVLNTSVIALAEELNIPLRELVEILGVELGSIGPATAAELAEVATILGANIFDLLETLDIGLKDLVTASGVNLDDLTQQLTKDLGNLATVLGVDVLELTKRLNISIADLARTFGLGIEAFSAEQFRALVAFSESLGIGVAEVAKALDVNLGEIADATSLLSEAFDIAIAALPEAIQADLGPLLEAIRSATTAADANAAINTLGTFILDLPPDLADLLIPFLDLIGFKQTSPEMVALSGIEQNTADTVAAIHALGGITTDPISKIPPPKITPPSIIGPMADGGSIDRTGLYQLHAGEFVVTKSANNLNVAANSDDDMSREELSQIKTVLVEIRDQNRRYQESDLATSRDMESSLKQQAEQGRRIANG